jgi:hypothetical protein
MSILTQSSTETDAWPSSAVSPTQQHLVDYVRFRSGGDEGFVPRDAEQTSLPDEDRLLEEAVGRTFALERDLQAALRKNLSHLEPGLAAIDGGSERRVEAGYIDILARDVAGCLTVIELKAETTRPEAVAQILGYMGCLAEETGERVRGILMGADHHPRVVHAARAVPDLTLKRYRFRFEFE